mgnify:CR=1 FL=1
MLAFSFSISVDTRTTFPSIESDRQKIISKHGDTGSFGGSPTETSFSQSLSLAEIFPDFLYYPDFELLYSGVRCHPNLR